jgi:hypothetical protein
MDSFNKPDRKAELKEKVRVERVQLRRQLGLFMAISVITVSTMLVVTLFQNPY